MTNCATRKPVDPAPFERLPARRGLRVVHPRSRVATTPERNRDTDLRRQRRPADLAARYSHLLAGLIPHTEINVYLDAAHVFLFQHHAEFAPDVAARVGACARTADAATHPRR